MIMGMAMTECIATKSSWYTRLKWRVSDVVLSQNSFFKKTNAYKHATTELDILRAKNDGSMDCVMRKHILKMVEVFSEEHHTNLSAQYVIGILEKLLKFEPVCPLTGDDSEWNEIGHCGDKSSGIKQYQNRRLGSVFKCVNADNSQEAYDIDGRVFYTIEKDESGDDYKSYFTTKGSRTTVTFPYVKSQVFVEA